MLTKAQIKKLPKGDYPNHVLVRMFPKQQGNGKSAKMGFYDDKTDSPVDRLINQFTGKPVHKKQKKS